MADFETGDLVVLPDGKPAVVVEVIPAQHGVMPMCDVRNPLGTINSWYQHELTRLAHRLASGQTWRCVEQPELVLEVVDVHADGLTADCRTPSGRVAAFVLHGLYELVS